MGRPSTAIEDLRLLGVRIAFGGLMAGHGAQKLFGWFGGHGLEGTGGWLESLGLRPGRKWAIAAGLSEFGGGLLLALGLLNPLGPIGIMASMTMASLKAHRTFPIWVNEGGPELPIVYWIGSLALGVAGPGRYSLDRVLGIRMPWPLAALAGAAAAAGVALGLRSSQQQPAATTEAPVDGQQESASA